MKLQIDSKDETLIALIDPNGETVDSIVLDLRSSQTERLLQEIDQILLKNSVLKGSLSGIIVNCGPGSYTGIRVGVTTANFLGFSLNVPVVCHADQAESKKFQRPVSAVYLNEPFITKRKPRLS